MPSALLTSGTRAAAGHHLSLKDMSVIRSSAAAFRRGRVASVNRGRLRPPEYVAQRLSMPVCWRGRVNRMTHGFYKMYFRVLVFTDSYLTGARNGSMFGTRTEGDAAAAGGSPRFYRSCTTPERPAW